MAQRLMSDGDDLTLDQILWSKCPRCGAEPRNDCTMVRGRNVGKSMGDVPHIARRLAATRAQPPGNTNGPR